MKNVRASSILLTLLMLCGGSLPAGAATPPGDIRAALKADLTRYLATHRASEHISAASLSVSLSPGSDTIDVAAGTVGFDGGAAVTPNNVFQIGSNTKAFTGVVVEHLVRAGKLRLDDTVGRWLPQYPQWKNLTIRELLDMTGGITTYDNTPAWEKAIVADPYHTFTLPALVAFVDPNAPLHPKWYYSNTGYILTEMIVQKASGRSYAAEVASVIEQAGLHQTFYAPSFYPPAIQERIVHGYYFNHDPGNEGLAPLLGKDVRSFSISWTQAAGGIAGTPHDLVSWARQLYTGPLLTAPERASMETLVSTKTGAPIPHLTKDDPRGFGLGVSQVMREPLGTFWFYEGETLGYRVAHIYIPKSNVVIVVALNSQASPSVDGIGPLLETIYKTLETHGMLH